MADAHIISALVVKIAYIQGEMESHYKDIKGFETKTNTPKQSLFISDENLICVASRLLGVGILCLNRES